MFQSTTGEEITSFALQLEKNQVSIAQISVPCSTGKFLRCESVANVTIEAKHNLSGTWINLETTPIDLTPWASTFQIFDLRFTAGSTALEIDFDIYIQ